MTIGTRLSAILILLSSPLAIGWHLLTSRTLHVQVVRFVYKVTARPGRVVHFSNKVAPITLRLLTRCPHPYQMDINTMLDYEAGIHRVPIGPVEIAFGSCSP